MVIAIALSIPLLLLGALLALGRYEERMLARPAPARHARSRRHLRVVAGSGSSSPAAAAGPAGRSDDPAAGSGRAA
ncbi:hypothetical protein GCM10010420_40670 [Streptomyces glaucosporus]|uniref:Secreted protein n=1 Tax=Streptomyces glaucosporus TaxID=284044 RepID=A0ABN3IM32_9ACTN